MLKILGSTPRTPQTYGPTKGHFDIVRNTKTQEVTAKNTEFKHLLQMNLNSTLLARCKQPLSTHHMRAQVSVDYPIVITGTKVRPLNVQL